MIKGSLDFSAPAPTKSLFFPQLRIDSDLCHWYPDMDLVFPSTSRDHSSLFSALLILHIERWLSLRTMENILDRDHHLNLQLIFNFKTVVTFFEIRYSKTV